MASASSLFNHQGGSKKAKDGNTAQDQTFCLEAKKFATVGVSVPRIGTRVTVSGKMTLVLAMMLATIIMNCGSAGW